MAPSAIPSELSGMTNGNGYHEPLSVKAPSRYVRVPSNLERATDDEVHDLICVGFGPASLAIAVALNDSLKGQSTSCPKVRFLERQNTFKWHAGMLLPGAKMQISFIKDLATLRDPSSHFTFLNYLKEHDRLVSFVNLGTFLPSRLEFSDYLAWAAAHFEDVVDYSNDVQSIAPRKSNDTGKVDCFEVQSRNTATGETTSLLGRNVVIAVGGRPSIPHMFPSYHDRILHSSEYNTRIEKMFPDSERAYSFAIMGAGQSAAEVFNDLHSRYPNASTRMIFRDSALRPSDDSPFVNEVFNPEAVGTFFDHPEEYRSTELKKNKATNYSVVRLELIEKIYDDLYIQGIQQPDKRQWQHQILPCREVSGVTNSGKRLELSITNTDPLATHGTESLTVDAVVLATGYRRDAHVDMLRGCEAINVTKNSHWQPERDYHLRLEPTLVEKNVGVWLQGCNEGTHGLSDSLLSILATRSGELVDAMFNPGLQMNGH